MLARKFGISGTQVVKPGVAAFAGVVTGAGGNGATNTGGGGGGSGNASGNQPACNGGSGIVIIRYTP